MNSDQQKRPILFQYFEASANSLLADYTRSGLQKSSNNLGANREFFCNNFLSKILPLKLSINSGEIWDSKGLKTGQLETIVTREDAPKLTFGEREAYLAEGVFAVIEIKSNLTREKLNEAGRQLINVKNLQIEISTGIISGTVINRPLRIVFAYEGATWKTLMNEITLQKWKNLFDLICILNRGVLIKTGLLLRSNVKKQYTYYIMNGKAASLGILYFYLISSTCSFLGRSLNFEKYFQPFDKWA